MTVAKHAARIAAHFIASRVNYPRRIIKNLLRDLIAASRGARTFAYPLGMSQMLCSVLLALETLVTVLGNPPNTGHPTK
jgi:hypothetical protein